ncbi:Uncharacterised protein [Staphylococcus aureus]|nr:Uncharacterised protein [Staphylococcus aureus]
MLETNPFGDFNQILKYLKHNCPVSLSASFSQSVYRLIIKTTLYYTDLHIIFEFGSVIFYFLFLIP